ncbi:glycosyltransferase family 39 protein [Candidatus Calescamantes bacterium]|nr:glycosyltransferase family 39 protein [Candidatus Calescamantes bacterium]
MEKVTQKKLLTLLFLLAFLPRLTFIFTLHNPVLPDEDTYLKMAETIKRGKGLAYPHVTASMPPVYPYFVVLITSLPFNDFVEIRFLQSILGGILALLIFILSKEIFNKRTALLSTLIYSFYPTLIFFTGLILSETFYTFLTFLFLLSLYFLYKHSSWKWIVLSGISGALSSLTRPSTISLIPFLYLFIILFLLRKRRRIVPVLLSLLLLAITYSPWVVRNWIVFHHFILTTTDGGWVLYSGNNPMNRSGGGIEGIDVKFPEEAKNLNEIERDQYFKKKAIEFIRSHPKEFILLSFKKFSRLWRLYPSPTSGYDQRRFILTMLFSYGILLPFAITGFLLSFRNFQQTFFLSLPLIIFTLTHMVFIGSIRYRVPLLPCFIIFSAWGVDRFCRIRGDRRINCGFI